MFDRHPNRGDRVFSADGVPLGNVHEVERHADGSLWVGVVNPDLLARRRELMVPLEHAAIGDGRVDVAFPDADLEPFIHHDNPGHGRRIANALRGHAAPPVHRTTTPLQSTYVPQDEQRGWRRLLHIGPRRNDGPAAGDPRDPRS